MVGMPYQVWKWSSMFHHVGKDRLYCDSWTSHGTRGAAAMYLKLRPRILVVGLGPTSTKGWDVFPSGKMAADLCTCVIRRRADFAGLEDGGKRNYCKSMSTHQVPRGSAYGT